MFHIYSRNQYLDSSINSDLNPLKIPCIKYDLRVEDLRKDATSDVKYIVQTRMILRAIIPHEAIDQTRSGLFQIQTASYPYASSSARDVVAFFKKESLAKRVYPACLHALIEIHWCEEGKEPLCLFKGSRLNASLELDPSHRETRQPQWILCLDLVSAGD